MFWEEGTSNQSAQRDRPASHDDALQPGFRPLSPSFCHRPGAEAVSIEPDNCFPPVPCPRARAECTFPVPSRQAGCRNNY